jgi:hypothetical protein
MVSLHQNIGMLVARKSTHVHGKLCRTCVRRKAVAMTGTTLVAGWWGTISLVVTPFMIVNNLGYCVMSLWMDAPLDGVAAAPLDVATIARLSPHIPDLLKTLRSDGKFIQSVDAVATVAGVTREQVVKYMQLLVDANAGQRPTQSQVPAAGA